jgi:hypothetical protein
MKRKARIAAGLVSCRALLALAMLSGAAACTSDGATVTGTVQSEQVSPDGSVKALVSVVGTGATDVDVLHVYLQKKGGGATDEIMRTNASGTRISWVSKSELSIVVPCGVVLGFNNQYYVMKPDGTTDNIVRIVLSADGPARCDA